MIYLTIKAFAVAAIIAFISPAIAQTNSSETYRQLSLFGDIFERIRSEYVEDVSDEQLIEAAVNGMLSALDPHSSYLSPKNFRELQTQDAAMGPARPMHLATIGNAIGVG